ncbi:hypothetical protein [Sandaracinus amylolyticus]|uniref:Uncharacterized protein n=1 Tax=Sandaracinus amylolyticus TaxID=927083 RepID=A0A0F6W0H9_9BACT|nr:hypothetical protein [Sandaracinus amylolyticus]AKF04158.1 hypothetical protein DB32_001307 [Sandaracinus amylolyticus]
MQPFVEGGFPVWIVLAVVLVSHPLAIAAVITSFVNRSRGVVLGLSSAVLLFALTTVGVGVAGYFWSVSEIEYALEHAGGLDPAMLDAMREQGRSEASWSWICGGIGAALPLVLSLVGLGRGVTMSSTPRR